ncbi:exocyst complex component EXO70A1-like [Miscanthus floridulus]|uniref:exocyst complex component EXO70A1-like n=1 Tax=Miscanthus floridulus TaxID=154761 RepID=UPI00345AF320
MLRAGYGPEFAQVYVSARRDALMESVAVLGIKAITIEEVLRMEWSTLDQRMRWWSHAMRAVVRTFLADERWLYDEVFMSDEDLGHECFTDVARACVLQLLAFADALAVSPHATEKLYRTLVMYEALTDVRSELEALFYDGTVREFFAGEQGRPGKIQGPIWRPCAVAHAAHAQGRPWGEVSSTVQQLGSTVRHTIEFSHAIHGEASWKPVHGGEIHPMTRYVLNYYGLLADCCGTLDAVLGDADLDARMRSDVGAA